MKREWEEEVGKRRGRVEGGRGGEAKKKEKREERRERGKRREREEGSETAKKANYIMYTSSPTLWPLHHNDVIHYLDTMFTVEVSSTNTGIEIELESLQSAN